MFNSTHRRYNPLLGEWILVSPHRGKRPWQGQQEKPTTKESITYDKTCYLCPGNERAGGHKNPEYKGPFVFTNDYSAIPENTETNSYSDDLLKAKSEKGLCKVICYSENHSLTVPEMSVAEVEAVVRVWIEETKKIQTIPHINNIQIFENKGSVMGCSNPHPHCQIWAQESIPDIVIKEDIQQQQYFKQTGKTLLSRYLHQETEKQERIIFENNHFVILVPFWAVWPFETIIIPKRAMAYITEMTDEEITCFAEAYSRITCQYDNLFNVSFPYSAGIHQAPLQEKENKHWHWHMHFYPPLFRSAEVKKFMVGYEMLAEPQRDLTAEQAAELIRKQSDIHFNHK